MTIPRIWKGEGRKAGRAEEFKKKRNGLESRVLGGGGELFSKRDNRNLTYSTILPAPMTTTRS